MINSIPSSDSSTPNVFHPRQKRKKKTIKDLGDLSTIFTRTKRWRLLISERKSDRDRVTRSIELRLYPAGNLCRLTWPQSSASTRITRDFLRFYLPMRSVAVEAARRPDCMYTTGITGRESAELAVSTLVSRGCEPTSGSSSFP